MNEWLPRDFIERERQRVFEPDVDFARRTVARIGPNATVAGWVWDYVPSFAGPIMAASTVMVLALIGFQWMTPAPFPDANVGIVDAYLQVDAAPAEEWLYRDDALPEGEDLLIEISMAGGLR